MIVCFWCGSVVAPTLTEPHRKNLHPDHPVTDVYPESDDERAN